MTLLLGLYTWNEMTESEGNGTTNVTIEEAALKDFHQQKRHIKREETSYMVNVERTLPRKHASECDKYPRFSK